jgi:cytochrome P450
LRSSFIEALRLYHIMWSTRDVVKDWEVTLGGKTYLLKKGSRIMSMAGWLHHDPAIYKDPERFQYDRFVGESKYTFEDGTPVSEPTRFWGGGARYCPGRKFAQYESMAFVATLMRNYDMQLAPSTRRPGFLREVAGVSPAVPKDEVYIKMQKRTR